MQQGLAATTLLAVSHAIPVACCGTLLGVGQATSHVCSSLSTTSINHTISRTQMCKSLGTSIVTQQGLDATTLLAVSHAIHVAC